VQHLKWSSYALVHLSECRLRLLPRDARVLTQLTPDSQKESSKSSKLRVKSSLGLRKEEDPYPLFNDPLFPQQWHLWNIEKPGRDINVVPVWRSGVFGAGITVCIIDDGVDALHEDIRAAFKAELSFDFNSGKQVPIPDPKRKDKHGTRCAGLIVGRANNGICGVGVAPKASVSAVRILSASISTRNEAAAVIHRMDSNDIYSCSWGPADDGRAVDAPAPEVLRSFAIGMMHGRNGLGSTYVFAAGNGKSTVDNCNYDGYANGVFALTVGAIDEDDNMPPYMEPCANVLIVAYSSNSVKKMVTSDLGTAEIKSLVVKGRTRESKSSRLNLQSANSCAKRKSQKSPGNVDPLSEFPESNSQCTTKHGGTSAAAPLVSGVLALALSVRPDLDFRSLRHIAVRTAVPIQLNDSSWVRNAAGHLYSYKFGFGKLDASAYVDLARRWKSSSVFGPPCVRSYQAGIKEPICVPFIPSSERPWILERRIRVSVEKAQSFGMIENVTVRISVRLPRRGDLLVQLESPAGTRIPLTSRRPRDDSPDGLDDWTFGTVGYWGEKSCGDWIVRLGCGSPSKYSPNHPRMDSMGEICLEGLTLGIWGSLAKGYEGEFSRERYIEELVAQYYPDGDSTERSAEISFAMDDVNLLSDSKSMSERALGSDRATTDHQTTRLILLFGCLLLAFMVIVVIGQFALDAIPQHRLKKNAK
jgi:kexin